jgi:hypothetical protein
MSDFFLRARRVLYVIGLKDNLEIRQREKLKSSFRGFLYLPLPVTLISIIITTRLKNHRLFLGPGLVSKDLRMRNMFRVYFQAIFTCFCSGAYFYMRFLKCVDDVYVEKLTAHQITLHEARLVEDPEYFKRNTCFKYE